MVKVINIKRHHQMLQLMDKLILVVVVEQVEMVVQELFYLNTNTLCVYQ